MFDELIHAIMEQWSNIAIGFFSGVGVAKILSILIPLLPASYGIFIKWRTSGYRLVDRLDEFIQAQDERLNSVRAQLSALVSVPEPESAADKPVFSPRPLGRALRKMNWGFGAAATSNLVDAARLSADRARLSEKLWREHQRRAALAHLLLGAKAASRDIADPHERNAVRSEALEHFDRALTIDAKDVEALEYSGMMLLELNEPKMALQRFEDLAECRKDESPSVDLARALRLQAVALERQVPRRNTGVYDVLIRASQMLPPGCTIEHARVHEHLALASERLNYTKRYEQTLQRAWSLYHTLRNSSDGQKGLERVSARLAALNVSANGGDDRSSGTQPAASDGSADAPRSGFFRSLKPSG